MSREREITVAFTGGVCAQMVQEKLRARLGFRIVPEADFLQADFLVCDTFNNNFERFPGVRILLTGENHPANLNYFDYCLTHDKRESDRCMYFPYWVFVSLFNPEVRHALTDPRPPITADELRAQKRNFCAFVVRNPACRQRNRLVRHLMPRKRVSCGGPLMNNIGYCVGDKVAFMAQHLFGVAYENESSPGYLTEKLPDALRARCIPIYWGDPTVEATFNPKSFVHARRFKSEKELIQYVLELSEDYGRMAEILSQPILLNPHVLDEMEEAMYAFLARVFERGPGAIRRTRWQRINAVLSRFYGHGFFRTLRTISRRIRHKGEF